MDHFAYRDGELHAEQVPAAEIARRFGTPCYVYSRATLTRHYHAFNSALMPIDHLICYAVKANSNLAVLNVLAKLGAGFDIVSGGELQRVLKAGGQADKVVFSGVGKTATEMSAALQAGIHCFNVESEAELERLNEVAGAEGLQAPIALRVNPDVDAQTHPYISTGLKENKFGVDVVTAERLYLRAAEMANIRVVGIASHIGSQLLSLEPYLDSLERVLALVERLSIEGIRLQHIDIGGGLGVRYRDEAPPLPADLAKAVLKPLRDTGLAVHLEPGRAVAGNAGILLTRVEHLKSTQAKDFVIVDAAMNDLLRPSLYSAWQDIVPVKEPSEPASGSVDVVGPVCETGDFLGKDRALNVTAGDLLAVRTAGAYGFVMSSNYNSRPRVAEVMVDGEDVHLVRARETFEDLIRGEAMLPR